MKFPVKLLAVLSSFTLLCGISLPQNSYAASVSPTEITADIYADSTDTAAAKMREYMKNRTEKFTVEIPNNGGDFSKTVLNLINGAFSETGSGTEGDYLRFAVKNYSCSGSINSRTSKLTYTIQYYTDSDEEAMVTNAVTGILDSLSLSGKSDYEKISDIYTYTIRHITYSTNLNDPYVYSAYNAVVNGNAVCQGITQLLYRMYNDSGIPCRIIAGTSRDSGGEGNHVWLIVRLDGTYYLLDPTWDLNYRWSRPRYFLKGTDDFDSANPTAVHIPQGNTDTPFPDYTSDEFKAAYPVSQYSYSAPTYTLGDVNSDGQINSVDASMILAEYARISNGYALTFTGNRFSCADVNGDGKLDSADASEVLAYYAAASNGYASGFANFLKTH